jgi:hypothetical protein
MTDDLIQTELSAFLASPQASTLGVVEEEKESIARLFLTISYEMVGRPPRLLSGADMHGLLGHEMPNHFPRKSPLAQKVPAVLKAYVEHISATQEVLHEFDLRRGLESTLPEFLETVRTGHNPHIHHHHHHQSKAPVRREGPKVGRNDPCHCGNGKKFKKCHGKAS